MMNRLCLLLLLLWPARHVDAQTRPLRLDTLRTQAVTDHADSLPAVIVNDPHAAGANVSAINAWFQKRRDPTKNEDAVLALPKGRIYINDEIVVPPKTGFVICGASAGISYQLGNWSFTKDFPGGPETQLIWTGATGKAMVRLQSFGTVILGIKFQGRELPENDFSGTAEKATYGILVEGRSSAIDAAFPPTGKHHITDCSFVEVDTCFYFPPDETHQEHADTMRYGVLQVQGCNCLLHSKNAQSISHTFYAEVEVVGGAGGGTAFWFERGGHLVVNNLLWHSPGTILKLGGVGRDVGEFSPGANWFNIANFRWDTPSAPPQRLTLLDLTDANDYPYCVRMSGLIGGREGAHYDKDELILWGPSTTYQPLALRFDIRNLPEEFAANWPMGPPVPVSNSSRKLIPKPYEGLMVYNAESHKMQIYNGTSWDDL